MNEKPSACRFRFKYNKFQPTYSNDNHHFANLIQYIIEIAMVPIIILDVFRLYKEYKSNGYGSKNVFDSKQECTKPSISISYLYPTMKKLSTFLLCNFISLVMSAQNIIGAWEANHKSDDGAPLKSVLIIAEGYQVLSTFQAETGKFIHTNGGSWSLEGNKMTEVVEFHTDDTTKVGKEISFEIEMTVATLSIVGDDMVFNRIETGKSGDLQGAWIMSGRIRNGQTQSRDINRPRKTMKILSGTRFQWMAYNTETKEFKGTGGGTFTAIDGKYTENIEFFSKDDNKVGVSLTFDYLIDDGDWHHSGLSSKGSPIYEIWSIRE